MKQLFALFLIHQGYQKRSEIAECKSSVELEDKLNTNTDADLAPELVYAAEDFAQGVQALLKIIGEVTRDSKSEKKVLYN